MVRKGGLEPPPLAGPDPKSGASANSATFALNHYNQACGGWKLFGSERKLQSTAAASRMMDVRLLRMP
jgi:hypothetical protein